MVLRVSSPMPQDGSRKGGTCEAWFSEPAKKKFEGLARSLLGNAVPLGKISNSGLPIVSVRNSGSAVGLTNLGKNVAVY